MANIFHIDRPNNKITLGTTDTTINIASHTASRLLALDASKNLEVVTIGSSLDYTRPTLNTIQDIRTSASPEFAGLTLTGDMLFSGAGSGLVFGAMYNDNTDTTVTIVSSGVAVRIPSGFTVGQVNGVTFGNNRELTVTEPGIYKIDWSISFRMIGGSNHEIEGAIGVGGTKNAQGSAHRFIGTNTDTGNMAGTAILDLADNAVISLMMENDTNTEDIVVNHASLSFVQVGGA